MTVDPIFALLSNEATAATKMPGNTSSERTVRDLAVRQVAYRALRVGYPDLRTQLLAWANEHR